jgi:ubiquinone/menaquinone biosynthesis C-methylase UbiE
MATSRVPIRIGEVITRFSRSRPVIADQFRKKIGMSILARLSNRCRQPEIMDDPNLDANQHRSALRGLSRINWISGSAGILWRPLLRLARENPGQALRVLDIGTGGGDIPIRLWAKFRSAGLPVELAGADVSPTALNHAGNRADQAGAKVQFFALDVLREPLPQDFDVITCSLFLHHFDEEQALELLRRMGQATRRLVLVNDLIRSKTGHLLAHIAARLFTLSPVVRVDAPRSVEAALTMREALELADRAGLHGASAGWRWPFRYLLQWRKPA